MNEWGHELLPRLESVPCQCLDDSCFYAQWGPWTGSEHPKKCPLFPVCSDPRKYEIRDTGTSYTKPELQMWKQSRHSPERVTWLILCGSSLTGTCTFSDPCRTGYKLWSREWISRWNTNHLLKAHPPSRRFYWMALTKELQLSTFRVLKKFQAKNIPWH